MSIEEVIEKSTIRFEKPLKLEEVEKLFGYLSKNLPAEVNYRFESSKIVSPIENRPIRKSYNQLTAVNVNGSITMKGRSYASDTFESDRSRKDLNKVDSIRFIPISGYSLDEHRPEVIKLWDDVREKVSDYFKQKSSE